VRYPRKCASDGAFTICDLLGYVVLDIMTHCTCATAGETRSPIPGVEGWNQTLASASEAVVRPPPQLLASKHHASSLSTETCRFPRQRHVAVIQHGHSIEVTLVAMSPGRLVGIGMQELVGGPTQCTSVQFSIGAERAMQVKAEREAPDDIDELQRMSVEHHAETHAEDRGVEAEELIDRSTRS